MVVISKVVVDEHVRKHQDISDSLVLELVARLDGERLLPEDTKAAFEYFATLIEVGGKQYRLVWLLEKNEIYIGVITVYRDDRSRDGVSGSKGTRKSSKKT
jgi:hypothetical protein